jgi:hypothetical protein
MAGIKTWVVLGVFALGLAALAMSYQPPYTQGPVHWHASVAVEVCGLTRELPCGNRAFAHGENACGVGLLHHHLDDTLHIEGQVPRSSDIRVGRFFEVIGSRFTKTELADKKNGDVCPGGGAGTVQLYVNGRKNDQLDDYVPKDGDRLRVVFG